MVDLKRFGFDRFHHIVFTDAVLDRLPMLAAVPHTKTPTKATDLRVVLALDLPAMQTAIQAIAQDHLLAALGVVDVLYPKRASQRYVGVRRDDIFPYLHVDEATGEVGHTGLKFSRMRSFNDDFTLLDLRWLAHAPRSQTTSSQRVGDYAEFLPQLQARLAHHAPQQAIAFAALPAGMQREWARYVYSPKRLATQNMHFEQMVLVLTSGARTLAEYKTRQHP
ncbi:YdeI/OmpD-associated family protein [Lacticaseibacillus baoqingensis]|uniref:YdeI/OmpD-associated family protein n=1 Tax=Lacticaseibacillus baoqingensis TaxID=2486013 RepID=A0ABW4E670_9LACO|nr:YdeI/OmpD-associated family protein [Lacticaseibacillus baoqingensis]